LVSAYRIDLREPAARASSSEQNQRLPFEAVMIVSVGLYQARHPINGDCHLDGEGREAYADRGRLVEIK
jgi:hypothetical protein